MSGDYERLRVFCGYCGELVKTGQPFIDHLRDEHPEQIRRLEAEDGPLEEQIAAAPVIDTTTDWRDEIRGDS